MKNDLKLGHAQNGSSPTVVGVSRWAEEIREQIAAVAACPSNVLITGPTGTGKEVIARAIHALSPRGGKPFIPVDCAAISGTLFAGHIFGHMKGAFTGAGNSTLGCFRAAHGGTIFIDEIGELECDAQTKLLRVLQQRTVIPLGSHQEIPVDVRVIAATNRDLVEDISGGRFREDLYYRLNVISLHTEPLRLRPEDIPILARHFLDKLAVMHGVAPKRLSAEVLECLQAYHWPGNVRELENTLERATFLSRLEDILVKDLMLGNRSSPEGDRSNEGIPIIGNPVNIGEIPASECCSDNNGNCCLAVMDGHWRTMEEVEREHLRRTLDLTNFNQSAAARLIGIERHQLARKIRKYELLNNKARQGVSEKVA
jgi:two-component system nitrogen regulation response regulator GlnG